MALNTTDADEELGLLRDAVWGTLGAPSPEDAPAPDPDWQGSWSELAALGVMGFCVPEAAGGFGFRVDAAVATAGALGAVLHGVPYAGAVTAAHALAGRPDEREGEREGGPRDTVLDLVADLLSGERLCAFGRLDRDERAARLVDGATIADALLLVRPSGDLVLLTDRAAWSAGFEHRFDVTRTITDVTVDVRAGHPIAAAATTLPLHGLLIAADALGGVQRMLDRTVRYAGERVAFGRPIGGFQAVQHRLVDHAVRARGMARLVDEAARLLGSGDPGAARAVAMAEAAVGGQAVHLLHDLLQLTGAIGFTWEHGLHLYERRAHQDARLGANPRAAVRALAAIEGWTDGR